MKQAKFLRTPVHFYIRQQTKPTNREQIWRSPFELPVLVLEMARNKGKSPKTVTILKLFWLICQDDRWDRSDSSVGTADEPSAVRCVQANDTPVKKSDQIRAQS